MNQLTRCALVTGVGRRNGIGAAICRKLGRQGYRLCFTYWGTYDQEAEWDADQGFPVAFEAELREQGVVCTGIEADLSRAGAAVELMTAANATLGEIAILVNNAAVSEQGGIHEIDGPMLDRHYAVNVRGMALLTRAFVEQFGSRSNSRIVNLTSGQGQGPMPDELAYAASKGAVEAFTTSVAPALAALGITVNAVNPGPTDTGWMSEDVRSALIEQFPMGRLGTPEDAANLVAFLVSEEAGWITGQIIHSEGGFWRK